MLILAMIQDQALVASTKHSKKHFLVETKDKKPQDDLGRFFSLFGLFYVYIWPISFQHLILVHLTAHLNAENVDIVAEGGIDERVPTDEVVAIYSNSDLDTKGQDYGYIPNTNVACTVPKRRSRYGWECAYRKSSRWAQWQSKRFIDSKLFWFVICLPLGNDFR